MNSPHALTPADYRALVNFVASIILPTYTVGGVAPDESTWEAAKEDARAELDVSWIAKFDYMSDTPGYSGPVFIIIFPAGPESHVVLIERDGELQLQDRGTDHLHAHSWVPADGYGPVYGDEICRYCGQRRKRTRR